MKRFIVKVKTDMGSFEYIAIANNSFDLHAAAIDRYGVCSVIITNAGK